MAVYPVSRCRHRNEAAAGSSSGSRAVVGGGDGWVTGGCRKRHHGSLPVQRAEIDGINSGYELVPTEREFRVVWNE